MYKVLKRDGITVEFDISKISAAMIKAFDALEKNYHPSVINLLALQVASDEAADIFDLVLPVLRQLHVRGVCLMRLEAL